MQNVLIAILPTFLALALVELPAFGPFLDHHFAERQPYHAHLGAGGGGHAHEFAREHFHTRADSPSADAGRGADGDEAMPNSEIAPSVAAAVRAGTGAMTPMAAAAADSAPAVARGGDSFPKSIYPMPPLRTPSADMAASVFPLYP